MNALLTAKRSISRWPQVCILLLAVALLPVGPAVAGDRNAAEGKRDGEKKEAREKKEVRGKKPPTDEYYKRVWKRLQAAVEAGELTQEEARAKMAAIKKEKSGSKTMTRKDYAKTEAKLRKAVEAGEISAEDARKKLHWMRREMAGQGEREHGERKITGEDYDHAEAELLKAVEAGRISAEDARKRLAGMRHRIAMQGGPGERAERQITREDYARAEAELKKAIATGRISIEDAHARLQRMRKAMAAQGERGGGSER